MSAAAVIEGLKAAAELTPVVAELINALVDMGKAKNIAEAAAMVKHDIVSRRAEYEQQKAEDFKALEVKHGRATAETEPPPNPFEPPVPPDGEFEP